MSEFTQPVNTGNQLQTNYDVSKIFIGENRTRTDNYTNSTGGAITLKAGTLMGRISSSALLLPCKSDAVDGSQFPVGVLVEDFTVANGASQPLPICIYGDVAEEKIILLKSGDTLNTVISGRTIRDRIGADTVGIRLIATTELTGYDN